MNIEEMRDQINNMLNNCLLNAANAPSQSRETEDWLILYKELSFTDNRIVSLTGKGRHIDTQ